MITMKEDLNITGFAERDAQAPRTDLVSQTLLSDHYTLISIRQVCFGINIRTESLPTVSFKLSDYSRHHVSTLLHTQVNSDPAFHGQACIPPRYTN
jgi:hypothetical protein